MGIEGGLYKQLDVSYGEVSSLVRTRNDLLVSVRVRRIALGICHRWRNRRKNRRLSAVEYFHEALNLFNNHLAFTTITAS